MDNIENKIKFILSKIRPYIRSHGGDVEYVKFEDGIVYVRMLGACVGCSALDTSLNDAIEAILLEEVPEVIGVENLP